MKKVALATRNEHDMKLLLGVALTLLTLLAGRLAAPLGSLFALGSNGVSFLRVIIRSVIGVASLIALGGASWLIPNLQKIREAWHFSRTIVLVNMAFSIIAGSWGVLMLLLLGEATPEQVGNVIFATVLCLFVGLNEEVMFRGLLFGGLLAKLGNRRNGPLMAALISSIAFGFVHVMFDIDYSNPMVIAQGLFKTIQTGIVGFVLCVPVLEGRNLIGASTVHSFIDWIVLAVTAFAGRMPDGTYVNSNKTVAVAAIVIYIVISALYLPNAIKAFKRLGKVALPQFGPFIAAQKSALLVSSAPADKHDGKPAHMGKRHTRNILNSRYATLLAAPLALMAVTNITSFLAALIFGQGVASLTASAFLSAMVSVGLLLAFGKLVENRFDGVLGWSKSGMLMVLPTAALALTNLSDWPGATFNNPLVALVLAMAPGIGEEIIFRAIPVSNWMRLGGKKDVIIESVVATSLLFGLIHLLNLLSGASLSATVFQVVYAICLGALFSAVLLRSGSIVPCIILHTFTDFLIFLTTDLNNVGILSQELTFDARFWIALVLALGCLGWAAWLLRPSKHQEIMGLWKQKWHIA